MITHRTQANPASAGPDSCLCRCLSPARRRPVLRRGGSFLMSSPFLSCGVFNPFSRSRSPRVGSHSKGRWDLPQSADMIIVSGGVAWPRRSGRAGAPSRAPAHTPWGKGIAAWPAGHARRCTRPFRAACLDELRRETRDSESSGRNSPPTDNALCVFLRPGMVNINGRSRLRITLWVAAVSSSAGCRYPIPDRGHGSPPHVAGGRDPPRCPGQRDR